MGYADKNWNWDGGNDSSKDTNKYRISIYNRVGNKANGDKTASYGKKFKFKKSISVTFKLTIK